jgi:hypothetical protein
MPYSVELFNHFNAQVNNSRNNVSRHIQYLLKPDEGYQRGSDDELKDLYNIWRGYCLAMDSVCEQSWHLIAKQKMIELPPDLEEYLLCRMLAAVIIERNIYGEHIAQAYLPDLVEKMKASNCHTHPNTCACHNLTGWTYTNAELMNSLSAYYIEREIVRENIKKPEVYVHNVDICACGECYAKRVANGTSDAYMKRCQDATDKVLAKDSDFVKNLFKVVQGVNYNDKCIHGLPFYACMPCSH